MVRVKNVPMARPSADFRSDKAWLFLLRAAILGAALATVLSSVVFVGLFTLGAHLTRNLDFLSNPTLWDMVKATAFFCVITAEEYGPFGFAAGALGGAVLFTRKKRIRTFKRLFGESVVLGLATVFLFPVYELV